MEPYKQKLAIINSPFIAIGLSLITDVRKFPFTIYKFNHRKIVRNGVIDLHYIISSTRAKTRSIGYILLKPKIAMWLWTIHPNNDSKVIFTTGRRNRLNMELNINKNVVFKKFNVLL